VKRIDASWYGWQGIGMTDKTPDDLNRVPEAEALRQLLRLLRIMAQLRNPDGGCPWDLQQDFATIVPYTIEEAYEVAEAVARADMPGLEDELGDLLLQVVFHARMAEEAGHFDIAGVARAIGNKMVRRHPHVFADADRDDAEAVRKSWEEIKAAERAARGKPERQSLLDDVALALPALLRSVKLQKRAARVGFDWSDRAQVWDKLNEELIELRDELNLPTEGFDNKAKIEEEFGDLLFVMTNLARHLDIDPEAALRGANAKFTRRFQHIEETMTARGQTLADSSLEEMEDLWQEAKRREGFE